MKRVHFILLIHSLCWGGFLLLPFLLEPHQMPVKVLSHKTLQYQFFYNTLLAMGAFYLHYIVLVPRYLLKGKKWMYGILLLFTAVIFQSLLPVLSLILEKTNSNFQINYQQEIPGFPIFLIALTVSYTLRISREYQRSENNKILLEKENRDMEIIQLKAQINPHFFFNTLNGIYALAIRKSDSTPDAILRLSRMMRYVLQDSEQKFVTLELELDYIKAYIDLQRLRIGVNNQIEFTSLGLADHVLVMPMLFIPFIENAFKYGVSPDIETLINISFEISEREIAFRCINYTQQEAIHIESLGIGIENTKKRLQLAYPDRHWLKISQDQHSYSVELKLLAA